MHSEQVEASDAHLKNAILDVKAVSNVDIGPAEVDVTKVVVERMPAKKFYTSCLKHLNYLAKNLNSIYLLQLYG